jgi:hypothetical protein
MLCYISFPQLATRVYHIYPAALQLTDIGFR